MQLPAEMFGAVGIQWFNRRVARQRTPFENSQHLGIPGADEYHLNVIVLELRSGRQGRGIALPVEDLDVTRQIGKELIENPLCSVPLDLREAREHASVEQRPNERTLENRIADVT